MHAVTGRVVRSLRRCDGGVMAALEDAAARVGARVRPAAIDAFREGTAAPAPVDYLVSIRQEDRERFEETIHPARARWVGETEAAPGIRTVSS